MALKGISERERRLLVGSGIVAAFMSTLLLIDVPLFNSSRQMERRSLEEGKRLKSIMVMGREYLSVNAELDDIKGRAFSGAGAALTGIDSIVTRSGLRSKMASLRPTASPITEEIKAIRAEASFERISLADLARLIAAMEADGHPVTIERFSIKSRYDDAAAYNATLLVHTLERE